MFQRRYDITRSFMTDDDDRIDYSFTVRKPGTVCCTRSQDTETRHREPLNAGDDDDDNRQDSTVPPKGKKEKLHMLLRHCDRVLR